MIHTGKKPGFPDPGIEPGIPPGTPGPIPTSFGIPNGLGAFEFWGDREKINIR